MSRGSLREALRVLEHAGVLDARPGSGTYVSSVGDTPRSLLRARAEVSGEHSPLDLLVVRAVIEPTCAEHAALYHRPDDLEAIRAAYEDQRAKTAAGLDASVPDQEFHLAIARATQNSLLYTIEELLVSVMHEDLWSDLKGRSRSHAGAEFVEHHRLILRAIEQRDGRRASQVMAMHISAIETSMIAEVED